MFGSSERRHEATVWILLIAAGLAAFFAYAFLSYAAPLRANSPDENANRFFSELFASEGKLWTYDPLDIIVPDVIHPRSTRVIDNAVVPIGFLGLPVIFGYVARSFGNGVLPFVTPLLGVLGAVAWGLISGRFFGRRLGIAAYLALLIQPAWWYESGRVFMPNVLFVTLVLWATYFLLVAPLAASAARQPKKKMFVAMVADGPLAGVLFGLALAVRPVEVYWLALAALVLVMITGWRRLPVWRLVLTAVVVLATLAPFLALNQTVYGNWLATGYASSVGEVQVANVPQGQGNALLGPLRPYLFPLGFAPRLAWQNLWDYGVALFGWWSVLIAAAMAWLAWSRRRAFRLVGGGWSRPTVGAVAVMTAITLWLAMFYGSWIIHDNPDPNAISVGSSYLRYWLPLAVLWTLPFAAAAGGLVEKIPARLRVGLTALLFIALSLVSGAAVFSAPAEGFLALRSTLVSNDSEIRRVLALTEDNALVVTDRSDKLVFPDRSVIYPLRSDVTYETLGKLAGKVPLYYLGVAFPEKDLQWLNSTKLPPLGLRIEKVADFGVESLYAFRPLTPAVTAGRPVK